MFVLKCILLSSGVFECVLHWFYGPIWHCPLPAPESQLQPRPAPTVSLGDGTCLFSVHAMACQCSPSAALLFPERLCLSVCLLHDCILNTWPAVTASCTSAVEQPVGSLLPPTCTWCPCSWMCGIDCAAPVPGWSPGHSPDSRWARGRRWGCRAESVGEENSLLHLLGLVPMPWTLNWQKTDFLFEGNILIFVYTWRPS